MWSTQTKMNLPYLESRLPRLYLLCSRINSVRWSINWPGQSAPLTVDLIQELALVLEGLRSRLRSASSTVMGTQTPSATTSSVIIELDDVIALLDAFLNAHPYETPSQ